ncbi:MAG: adenylate/guanylate cyclase domain-containing protein [Candidatus Firestonebacteria bacterium]
MPKEKLRKILLKEFILYGIFIGLLIFLIIKLLFVPGNILSIDVNLIKVLSASIVAGVLIAGLVPFILSKLSVKNELFNLIHEIVVLLQNKGLLTLEHKTEKPKDIKNGKNKIFSLIITLTDKILSLNKRNIDLENTIARFTDLKTSYGHTIPELKGEVRNVTVLFTDIRNFTALCEKITSDDIIIFLNSYLKNVTKIVHEHDGIINKFIGDAVMASFEVSRHVEGESLSHELRAVSAALEIHKVFDVILEEANIKLLGSLEVGLGIGINSGNAVIGTIGSEERMEFTVIGDTVNIASRLSMMAGIGATLIGSDIYEKIRDKIEVIETEPVSIRGKSGLHKVYIVKGIDLITR